MGYTILGKNAMLDALVAVATHAGLLTKTTITGVTGVAATDLFTKVGHGLINGDVVQLSGLTGGAGLFNAVPYFVVGVLGNDFQLASTPAGAAINFTTDITAVAVEKYVEVSGGTPAYARKAIVYAAAAGGIVDDSTNGAVFNVPAGTVSAVGKFSALTAGTLYGLDPVTEEVFAAQGLYTVTDIKMDLNGDLV